MEESVRQLIKRKKGPQLTDADRNDKAAIGISQLEGLQLFP
jgi:hypothetical protein